MDTILRLMIHIQTRSALSRAPFTILTFDKLYLTLHNDDIIIVVISNTRYLYILNTYCHRILVNMKISQMFLACDSDRVSSTSNTQWCIQYSKHFSLVFTRLLLAAYFLSLLLFLTLVNCNQWQNDSKTMHGTYFVLNGRPDFVTAIFKQAHKHFSFFTKSCPHNSISGCTRACSIFSKIQSIWLQPKCVKHARTLSECILWIDGPTTIPYFEI